MEKTYYTPKQLNSVLKRVRNLKMEATKAQDYEIAASFRDIEKYYLDLIEKDKQRKI
jgi:hypothetical protein